MLSVHLLTEKFKFCINSNWSVFHAPAPPHRWFALHNTTSSNQSIHNQRHPKIVLSGAIECHPAKMGLPKIEYCKWIIFRNFDRGFRNFDLQTGQLPATGLIWHFLTFCSNAFLSSHFSTGFVPLLNSGVGLLYFGSILIANCRNCLSRNGTRTSSPFAIQDLSARRQSAVDSKLTRRMVSYVAWGEWCNKARTHFVGNAGMGPTFWNSSSFGALWKLKFYLLIGKKAWIYLLQIAAKNFVWSFAWQHNLNAHIGDPSRQEIHWRGCANRSYICSSEILHTLTCLIVFCRCFPSDRRFPDARSADQ